MANTSFFAFAIVKRDIIELNISINLAPDNIQLSDTTKLSNHEIVSLYIEIRSIGQGESRVDSLEVLHFHKSVRENL